MKIYINIWYLSIVIISSIVIGVIAGVYFIGHFEIKSEAVSAFAESVIATSAVLALAGLVYTKTDFEFRQKKEHLDLVMEQVNFFRDEIILKLSEDVARASSIVSINSGRAYSSEVPLEFSINTIRSLKRDAKESKNFSEYRKNIFQNRKNNIFTSQANLLNALEQFSMYLDIFNIQDDEAFKAVKIPFVQVIEINSFALTLLVGALKYNYIYLIKLYNLWKKEVGDVDPNNQILKAASEL